MAERGGTEKQVECEYAEAGRAIRSTAERMLGIMVKAGQFLSLRQEVFPATFTDALRTLQDDVPPGPFDQVRACLEAELKQPLEDIFVEFEKTPVASASLSQVHRGVLKSGEVVAVKVLRPGIEKMAETDLATLSILIRVFTKLPGVRTRMNFTALHEVFSETIFKELDMRAEAGHMEQFRQAYEEHAQIYVPKVYHALTTKRVLVMEFMEGAKIRDVELWRGWGIDPMRLYHAILDVYLEQILVHGFIHLDPHPGNLQIMPDGRVALLDYGMVGELSLEEIKAFRRLVQAAVFRDWTSVANTLQELGYLQEHGDQAVFAENIRGLFEQFDAASFKSMWSNTEFKLQARYMLIVRCVGLLKTVLGELSQNQADGAGELSERALPILLKPPTAAK